ncbi:MAG TPA: hypothetical protein VFZ78_12295, partial [Flavisolibacter sp.]
MKKLFSGGFVILMTLLGSQVVMGQSAVNLNLTITPPYPPRLSDYGSQPGKVILMMQNNMQMPVSVFLRVTITGDNGITAMTSPNYVPSQPIQLAAFQTVQADLRVLGELFDENKMVFQGITLRDVARGNGLPEGNYTICVQAFDYTSGQPLSPGAPMGCRTIRIASLEPPILLRPLEEEEIRVMQPQNVIFTWTVPAGIEPGALYQLRIVEMLDPKRNPNDAFISATAPAFFETTVQGNVFVFGPAQPTLVPDRRYAWAVTVLDKYASPNQNPTGISIRNNGRSEVRSFYYGKKDSVATTTIRPAITGARKPLPGNVKFTPDRTVRNLNRNIFKGRLVYAFAASETVKTEESSSSGGEVAVVTQPDYAALEAPPSQGTTASQGSPAIQVFGGGASRGHIGISKSMPEIKALSPQERKQQAINMLASDKRYPLSGIQVEIRGVVKKIKPGGPGQAMSTHAVSASKLLGTAVTGANGEFEIVYSGDELSYVESVTLLIKTPYFEYAAQDIRIVPDENGTYDIGDILGLARTIRLKVNVTDQDGKKLESAKIQVLRAAGFYQHPRYANLAHEIMHDEVKSLPSSTEHFSPGPAGLAYDLNYAAILVGEATGSGLFRKVFINDNLHDKYIIRITGENASPKTYQFVAEGFTGDITKGQVVTIEKTYKLPLNNPAVTGRVLVKQGNLPVQNATVVVLPKKYEHYDLLTIALMKLLGKGTEFFTATTNDKGSFRIENILVSAEPYALKVFHNTSQYKDPQSLFLTARGTNVERDPVFINAELVAVCGSVTDMNGNPLGNTLLRWKSGGESFTSNAEGQFLTTQTEGRHILVAQLPGYKDTELEIVVTKPQKSSNTKVQNVTAPAAGNFLAPAVKNLSGTKPASAASFISAG